ncbi:hypothetical protein [Vampirovibrio sp.]|uniref:hypothetical protein n=1 Tax=Vampirovibrio sp. TaxID=2717857 RepID=UPI003593A9A4
MDIPTSLYPMQKIYEEAGFDAEGSRRLAGLFELILSIRARRQREANEAASSVSETPKSLT